MSSPRRLIGHASSALSLAAWMAASQGAGQGADLALIAAGQTGYAILLAEDAAPVERNAATELSESLQRVTGADFPLVRVRSAPGTPVIAVGPGAALAIAPDLQLDRSELGDDGIVLKVHGRDLLVTGARGASRGTLYAVYELLERHVGVRWWTMTESLHPRREDLAIPGDLDYRFVPPFLYRDNYHTDTAGTRDGRAKILAARHRLNGAVANVDADWGGHLGLIGGVHTLYGLLPPATYFADHPEWYSEVNGQRQERDAQLCWTNQTMIAELTKSVLTKLRQFTTPRIISVSINDNDNYCLCAACRAVNEANGSPAGTVVAGVNQVAEAVEREFPEVLVETIAYQHTKVPPAHVRPRSNVLIRFAPIERSATQPLDHAANRPLFDILQGWSAISRHLFIWDYTENLDSIFVPHPNLPVFAPDLRSYARHKVVGVLTEGDNYNPSFGDRAMRNYVLNHLMWDPELDADALAADFIQGYYGPAAPPVAAIVGRVNKAAASTRISCYKAGMAAPFLDLPTMNWITGRLDEARAAAAQDAVAADRLASFRIQFDHQWLRLHRAYLEASTRQGLPFAGPTDPIAAVNALRAACARYGVVSVRWVPEWKPADYFRELEKVAVEESPLSVSAARVPAAGGELGQVAWEKASPLPERWFVLAHGEPSRRRLAGRIGHDGVFIYLELTDYCQVADLLDTPTLFPADTFEFFAAPSDKRGLHQFAFNPGGRLLVARLGVAVETHGTRMTSDRSQPDRWTVRAAIPLSDLVAGGAQPGDRLFFNMLRVAPPPAQGQPYDVSTPVSFSTVHALDRLGTLQLAP